MPNLLFKSMLELSIPIALDWLILPGAEINVLHNAFIINFIGTYYC